MFLRIRSAHLVSGSRYSVFFRKICVLIQRNFCAVYDYVEKAESNKDTVKSEDLFQPQNANLPEALGADTAHCGGISATAGTKLPPLKADTAQSGTQFGPLVPAQPL